ncbi:hypothetical protein [Clostridioides difficile]|uniref:hypothetical protein n=1 Tax=Clostridioides difficile TaxID=1496 RepID=UPI000D1E0B12|nr:hypothetical protein [Clostridioides difficile]MCW0785071.1 hypothetical protein [Clostridioides difficile]MDE3445670.1 hypothetical protein [Clostridioides difficile]WID69293.1 hypothetical protein ITJ29_09960 [Clostridioides difficile]HBG0426678.1 hypothetical protein [Clostridioides difficile]HBG2115572.1 hypothetical protein [Clostridioides difficile]
MHISTTILLLIGSFIAGRVYENNLRTKNCEECESIRDFIQTNELCKYCSKEIDTCDKKCYKNILDRRRKHYRNREDVEK